MKQAIRQYPMCLLVIGEFELRKMLNNAALLMLFCCRNGRKERAGKSPQISHDSAPGRSG
jgi:hypothetical protein